MVGRPGRFRGVFFWAGGDGACGRDGAPLAHALILKARRVN